MFNISFSELLIILLIAFLVVGPKDLAKVARSLGKAVKKGRDFIYDVKSYVNDGTEDSPIKDVKDTVADVKKEVDNLNPLSDVKKDIEDLNPLSGVKKEIKDLNPLSGVKKGDRKS